MQKIGGGVVNTNAIDGLIDLSLESVIDAPRKPLWKTAGWLRANTQVLCATFKHTSKHTSALCNIQIMQSAFN